MSMTENGVSTTNGLGEERLEVFISMGKSRYQYDYRHTNGKLFSCIGKSLADCRAKRDAWLSKMSD